MASIRLALIVCAFFFADAHNHSHANGTNGSGDPATTSRSEASVDTTAAAEAPAPSPPHSHANGTNGSGDPATTSRSEVSVDTTAAPNGPAPSPPGTTQAPAKTKVKGSMTMEGISKETAEALKPKVKTALANVFNIPEGDITMGAIEEVTRRLGEERRLNASTKLKMTYEILVEESKATTLTTLVKAATPAQLVAAVKEAVKNDATLLAKLDNLAVAVTVDSATTAAPGVVVATTNAGESPESSDNEDSGCDRVRTEFVFASVALATVATFW